MSLLLTFNVIRRWLAVSALVKQPMRPDAVYSAAHPTGCAKVAVGL